MKITKYPVGFGAAAIVIALMAKYSAFTSVGGTASVVICFFLLMFGWMAPVQIMRD